MAGGSRGRLVLARLVPDATRQRFLAKFVLSVVVVLLVTAGLGAHFYGKTTATLTDRTDSQVRSTAQLQADELGRWVEGLRHQTRLISQAPPFRSIDESAIDLYLLRQRQQLRSDIHAIHYVDTQSWEILVSTHDEPEGTNATAAMDWIREDGDAVGMRTNVPANVVVPARPYASPAGGERVLAFVSAPPEATQYLVVVEADLSACQRSFDQPAEAAFTTVHTADGTRVCGGTGGDATVPPGALSAAGAGVAKANDSVVGYAPVNATQWTVLTHVPRSAAYGLRQEIGTSMLALVVVPLVTLGLVAAVTGRGVSAELAALTAAAERMRAGDLDVDIDTGRADEFGTLARGFAEMRDALRQRIDEAEQARREAELARTEAVELSEHLQSTAAAFSETMAACARGDLTRRLDDDENEAMDRVATDFNEMVRELELTIGQLKRFAREVDEGGKSLHDGAVAVRDASEQIADSIQQVSDEAYEQTDRLDALAAEVESVADDVAAVAEERDDPDLAPEELADRLRSLRERLDAATESAETVMAESETVAGAAEEQAAELNEVSERAAELRRTARHLGDGLTHFETENEHEFVFQTGGSESDATLPTED